MPKTTVKDLNLKASNGNGHSGKALEGVSERQKAVKSAKPKTEEEKAARRKRAALASFAAAYKGNHKES